MLLLLSPTLTVADFDSSPPIILHSSSLSHLQQTLLLILALILVTVEIVGPYWELRHEDGTLEGIPLIADYSGDQHSNRIIDYSPLFRSIQLCCILFKSINLTPEHDLDSSNSRDRANPDTSPQRVFLSLVTISSQCPFPDTSPFQLSLLTSPPLTHLLLYHSVFNYGVFRVQPSLP